MRRVWLAIAVGVILFGVGIVQMGRANVKDERAASTGQHSCSFEKTITKKVECRYLLFLPEGYGREKKKWPLILFLHGAGERGSNLELLKKHGPPKIVENRKDFGFIVVSPQCPSRQWWTEKLDTLIALLDEIVAGYDVDRERIYLTGLSMGGYGTWALASAYPDRFAAIAPICGGGLRFMALRLKDVPVWAFHGAKDRVVPVAESEQMVKAINAVGGNAKLTVYPDAYHDSWTRTYENPELYEWFLKHRRILRTK